MKQEILHNTVFTLEQYELDKSLMKANDYMSASSTKKIKSEANKFLHYGITDNSPLSMKHLLAVILYCDWSELCTIFSASFRQETPFEPIQLSKKRNMEFANWSKNLREIVELYGKRGWEKRDKNEKKWNEENNRIGGPFYCGMSTVMVIPEFNIRLCAPTSTSSESSVADRFADEGGIIIELNNTGHWHSNDLRIWDCSWISNYSGEDEKLMIGGFYTIRIQAVIVKKTNKNFKQFFAALFYYDCMLTGISMLKQNPRITNEHKRNILHITNIYLNKTICNDNKNCDNYIHDTFSAYTNHRKQIVINLHQIHTYFGKLKNLILEIGARSWECSVCYRKDNNINSSTCYACHVIPSKKDNVYKCNNVLKADIFKLFQKINSIVIYTTSGSGRHEYVFDLTKLFERIPFKKIGITIEIKATHRYKDDKHVKYDVSWLSKEWDSSSKKLKSFLSKRNWSIKSSDTINHGARDYEEQTLTITARK